MIKENQRLLNQINILSDGLISFLLLPLAYWLRFYVIGGGTFSIPFDRYVILSALMALVRLFVYASFGLYRSFRAVSFLREFRTLCLAELLDTAFLLSYLFINHNDHYSRLTLGIYIVLCLVVLGGKRMALRRFLRGLRKHGFNQKHVLIIGSGNLARKYLDSITRRRDLGYTPIGYISSVENDSLGIPYLGGFDLLDDTLALSNPDEAISAIDTTEYAHAREIIEACERAGTKLSIIPFYSDYITSSLQFDEIDGIPLLNIRRIPLDNMANAFCKRAMDVTGSALLILLTSPVMLVCALGVRLSSPGPVIFRQKRVGLNKKEFYMYKFRSMKVNSAENTGWSSDTDDRKTRFGSFIRKFSLDELPQFFNVLKGDMSLVGPRPEIPYYVDRFKDDVPLYMVKHQVRPGITGWAQVNGYRGDTSIRGRIEHDVYYIEHWSLAFDIKILFMTLFGGKFVNSEKLKGFENGS